MYRGTTTSGDKIGRTLGFPTVNITLSRCDMGKIFSGEQAGNQGGVFLVSVFFSGTKHFGLLHLGSRPTFEKSELRVEIFLLNFSDTVPENSRIHFEILKKIRDIQKFNSPEALVEQIQKDVQTAENFLESLSQKEHF